MGKLRGLWYKIIATIMVFNLMLVYSCKQDEKILPDDIYEINSFIYDVTNTYYLWEDYIPSGIDINSYTNPEDLFNAMYYPTLDHWSFVSDDYQTVLNSFDGIKKSTGYKIQLFKFAETEDVYGIIEYVYEGGPAAIAGVQRGDVIISVNGEMLNTSNYAELLTLDNMELGLGEISGDQIIDLHSNVSITLAEMNINPVLQYKVIEEGGKKIGYLLYDQFIENYFDELESVFTYFKGQGIDEVVLDLRYNPGGYVSTCAGLASMLVPASALDDVFLFQQWNAELTQYLTGTYGANSEYFVLNFPEPSVNLDLSRIIVLTSERTASASEALINGLDPYMQVITIGGQTSGKYTGASLFYDELSFVNYWCVYLVINKIANANGLTDFVEGFVPDYSIEDDYSTPVGDLNEPLLAKAIEVITGLPAKKTGKTLLSRPFDRIYGNRFEENGMMINKFELN